MHYYIFITRLIHHFVLNYLHFRLSTRNINLKLHVHNYMVTEQSVCTNYHEYVYKFLHNSLYQYVHKIIYYLDLKCRGISTTSPSPVHHLYGNLEQFAFTVHGFNPFPSY
jgi:hypothetical protein